MTVQSEQPTTTYIHVHTVIFLGLFLAIKDPGKKVVHFSKKKFLHKIF